MSNKYSISISDYWLCIKQLTYPYCELDTRSSVTGNARVLAQEEQFDRKYGSID